MNALCWRGTQKLRVERVEDPSIVSNSDVIVKRRLSTTCGSDLHLLNGYVPTMHRGDIFGHEFMGEIVAVGRSVEHVEEGDRVVVSPILGCGKCQYCSEELYSLCDNSNPHPQIAEKAYGSAPAGIIGYSHAFGGYAGCHADYVRVPFADVNTIKVPDDVSDEQAVFASDAFPTGYMAADNCTIQGGDCVAIWGCGGVGLMAVVSAYLLGAGRVIAIDRYPERLRLAEEHGAEILNYMDVDIFEALHEMTGGRGPDACIDAVGMEAHDINVSYAYDRIKQELTNTDRSLVLRQIIRACAKGGVVSIVGVYGGLVDKVPLGAAMNKGLTFKMAQQHGPYYIPKLLKHLAKGEADTAFLGTHRLPLSSGKEGYDMFQRKTDECVRVIFTDGVA